MPACFPLNAQPSVLGLCCSSLGPRGVTPFLSCPPAAAAPSSVLGLHLLRRPLRIVSADFHVEWGWRGVGASM